MKTLFSRLLRLPKDHSFFVFGPRNTGKSTLIENTFNDSFTLTINLLEKKIEARFLRNPDELFDIVMQLPASKTHVFIDEIQKVPPLLDVVHRLMGETNKSFILTGSSARKLKRGGANLLLF